MAYIFRHRANNIEINRIWNEMFNLEDNIELLVLKMIASRKTPNSEGVFQI